MRTVLLYIVIVGLPIAGTSIVLESGRNLQALPAIGGTWTVQTSSHSTDQGCASPAGSGVATTMIVEQSGENLVLSLPANPGRPPLIGRLRLVRSDRAGITSIALQEARSHGGALFAFNATIDQTAVPFVMEGTFSAAACDGGRPGTFRAILSPAPDHQGGSH